MWDEIVSTLASYSSVVLSWMDVEGNPFSIRCIPKSDPSQKKFTIEVMEDLPIEPGPASLMCHSHDEALWDLNAYLVRGNLIKEGSVWSFFPSKFVKSGISSNPVDQMKGLIDARGTAKKYLEKRGIPRPKVPWDDIKLIRAEARKE